MRDIENKEEKEREDEKKSWWILWKSTVDQDERIEPLCRWTKQLEW